LKDLVLGQAKINESLNEKLTANDKILENINSQIEGLASVVKNQMSFNKMVETQLAQIAIVIQLIVMKKFLPNQKIHVKK
jgi:hypothetical protein